MFLNKLLWFNKPVVIDLLVISVIICLEQSIPCELCAIKFTRKPNLNIQMRSLHDIITNKCMYWQKHFLQPSQLCEHFGSCSEQYIYCQNHFLKQSQLTDHFGSCSAFLSTLFLAWQILSILLHSENDNKTWTLQVLFLIPKLFSFN